MLTAASRSCSDDMRAYVLPPRCAVLLGARPPRPSLSRPGMPLLPELLLPPSYEPSGWGGRPPLKAENLFKRTPLYSTNHHNTTDPTRSRQRSLSHRLTCVPGVGARSFSCDAFLPPPLLPRPQEPNPRPPGPSCSVVSSMLGLVSLMRPGSRVRVAFPTVLHPSSWGPPGGPGRPASTARADLLKTCRSRYPLIFRGQIMWSFKNTLPCLNLDKTGVQKSTQTGSIKCMPIKSYSHETKSTTRSQDRGSTKTKTKFFETSPHLTSGNRLKIMN